MGISVKNVSMVFGVDRTQALSDVRFDVQDGEFIALTGRSGSGKSTLLYVMSSLDAPTAGEVSIDGSKLATIKKNKLHHLRNDQIAFVVQFHYLLPDLTSLENVLTPAIKTKQFKAKRPVAEALLNQFEIGNKMHRLPRQLSGG